MWGLVHFVEHHQKRDFATLDDVVPPSKRTIDGAKLIVEDLLKRQKTYELLEMSLSKLPPRLRVVPKRYSQTGDQNDMNQSRTYNIVKIE